MKPITSRTTTERIVRTLLLGLLAGGYAAWSLYDGYLAYPRENLEAVLRDKLSMKPPGPPPAIDGMLTAERAASITVGQSEQEATSWLEGSGLRVEDRRYHFGPAGYLILEIRDGRIADRVWVGGSVHTATDLLTQKILGFGLAPVGLFFLVQLIRALTTRVSVTEGGLQIGRRPRIPFEAMTKLNKATSTKSRGIAIEYSVDGRPGLVHLDDYVVREFDAILAALCEQTGHANPLEEE